LDSRNYHANIGGYSSATRNHCQHSGFNGKQFCTGAANGGAGYLTNDYVSGCQSFCELNVRVCNGTNTQFASAATCVLFCLALPTASETPYVTSGDSLQCRFYHLQVAAAGTDALRTLHCPHTGPTGGDSASFCGLATEAFCDMAIGACNTTTSTFAPLAQYSSKAQCVAAASTYPRDSTGTVYVPTTSGNSLECRAYHAGVSLSSYSLAIGQQHCYHTGILGGEGVCGTGCAGFCALVMGSCLGSNAAYASTAECMMYCATFPASTPDLNPFSITSGNFLACRSYHASVANSGDAATKTLHCPHTGAVPAYLSGAATCGTYCESFCNTAQAACTGTLAQWSSVSACQTACASFATTGTNGDTTGNTLQCRQYHAGVALTGATAAATHCPHIGVTPTAFCVASAASSSGSSMTSSGNGASSLSASISLVAAAIVAAVVAKQL